MPIVVKFNQQSVNEDVDLAFSDYGVRLFTPPPPANQVLTYVQYQSASSPALRIRPDAERAYEPSASP